MNDGFEEWWKVYGNIDDNYLYARGIWIAAFAHANKIQMRAYPCQRCGHPTMNMSEGDEIQLYCPDCGWTPCS
jgi:hypothetical protein